MLKGDNLAAMTFWHGTILNEWAEQWVSYWTDGKGNFVTSAMEDTGTFQSLTYLHPTGKVNKDRVMVLRTASNYTTQPPGMSAAEHLLRENEGYAGLNASVEAAYRVGSRGRRRDRHALEHLYRDHSPAGSAKKSEHEHVVPGFGKPRPDRLSSTDWMISRRCRRRCSWRFSTCSPCLWAWSRRPC